ncbi:MAG: hypothetical protein ACNA8W_18310, partial [Bradymonadaceae bacterium]
DGAEVAREAWEGSLDGWNEEFGLIMGDGFALTTPWEGDIFQVAIYERILDDAEIAAHFDLGPFVTDH